MSAPGHDESLMDEARPKSSRAAVLDLVAIAVPPTAWFVHLNASYVLVPSSCRAGHRWYLLALTAAALVVIVPAARRSVRARRRSDVDGLDAFLGSVGTWFALLFAVATLLVGMAALVVGPCS